MSVPENTQVVVYDQTEFLLNQLGEGRTLKAGLASGYHSITTYPTLRTMHGDFLLQKITRQKIFQPKNTLVRSPYYYTVEEYLFTPVTYIGNNHSKGFYQLFKPHEEIGKLDQLARKYLARCIWIRL